MNALAGLMNPGAIGQQVQSAFQQGRAQREDMETRNALAALVSDPMNQEAMGTLAKYNPQAAFAMQDRQRAMQQQELAQAEAQSKAQAEQMEQRRADLPMLTRLLENATDDQTYQRSLAVASQYGIDTSTLPPTFDQEWRDTNLTTLKSLATPEGQEIMSTAGKQAYDEGLQPGTPEFQARVTEIWQQNGAIPYTGSNGETRLYVPGRQRELEPGAVVNGFRFKGGNPNAQESWEKVGGAASNGSGNFPAGQ